MSGFINKKTVIDADTGEIVKSCNWFGYDGFSETGYKYRNRSTNPQIFYDSIPGNLSEAAFILLVMIAEIANQDNVLVRRVERKSKFSSIIYKPMDKDDIRERTRYKYGMNKFDKCWTELNKKCIKKVRYYDYLVWAVNPAFICKCKYVPFWLYEEFQEYMNPHLTASAIKKLNDKLAEYNN